MIGNLGKGGSTLGKNRKKLLFLKEVIFFLDLQKRFTHNGPN